MSKILHRLPVIDGKTDKEKISQMSDAFFQLIRELNLEYEDNGKVKTEENVQLQTATNGLLNAEMVDVKNEIEDLRQSLSTRLSSMQGIVEMIKDRPYIEASGVLSGWNYTKWSNGDLEYWKTIAYTSDTKFSAAVFFDANATDRRFPTEYTFSDIPAISITAYCGDDATAGCTPTLRGYAAPELAKSYLPEVRFDISGDINTDGVNTLCCTVYVRGKTN